VLFDTLRPRASNWVVPGQSKARGAGTGGFPRAPHCRGLGAAGDDAVFFSSLLPRSRCWESGHLGDLPGIASKCIKTPFPWCRWHCPLATIAFNSPLATVCPATLRAGQIWLAIGQESLHGIFGYSISRSAAFHARGAVHHRRSGWKSCLLFVDLLLFMPVGPRHLGASCIDRRHPAAGLAMGNYPSTGLVWYFTTLSQVSVVYGSLTHPPSSVACSASKSPRPPCCWWAAQVNCPNMKTRGQQMKAEPASPIDPCVPNSRRQAAPAKTAHPTDCTARRRKEKAPPFTLARARGGR